VGLAAAVGAVAACGAAIAASPLMPIGPAKLAEPHPGLSADIPVLAAGCGAVVALLLARAAWPAWRQAAARFAPSAARREYQDAARAPSNGSRRCR